MVTRIRSPHSTSKRQSMMRAARRRKVTTAAFILCGLLVCYTMAEMLPAHMEQAAPGQTICVYNTETGALMQLDLEKYLVGVVAAEMPAVFDLEALKAQAVAARTFAVNRMQNPSSNVTALHPQAQITTSPETCQAWIDDATQQQRWGSSYSQWREKIVQAVSETEGQVLCYEGALIEPLYHASCGGGYTEAAEEVWGNARPYLVSVACNHPADAHTDETLTMTLQEFAEKMQLQGVVAAGGMTNSGDYIKAERRTSSNRVKEVRIGSETFSGGQMRSALGLKSSLMDWEIQGDNIVFTTSGYGHGVGLCQHGANYYAEQGNTYQQILTYYYPGTELMRQL